MKELRVAQSAGFCFGVNRSVGMAEKLLEEKGKCASLGQLTVAKNNKRADRQLIIQRADGQIALTAGYCHMIVRIHEVEPSFLPPERHGNNHRFYYTLISFFVNECTRHFSCFYATIFPFCVKTKQKQLFGHSAGCFFEQFIPVLSDYSVFELMILDRFLQTDNRSASFASLCIPYFTIFGTIHCFFQETLSFYRMISKRCAHILQMPNVRAEDIFFF